MSTGVVGPSSPTATSPPGPPVTDEVVSSSSSFAPATVPVPPPPSDSFVGGDFLFEDILNLQPIPGINSFSAPRYGIMLERRRGVRGSTCAGNDQNGSCKNWWETFERAKIQHAYNVYLSIKAISVSPLFFSRILCH